MQACSFEGYKEDLAKYLTGQTSAGHVHIGRAGRSGIHAAGGCRWLV